MSVFRVTAALLFAACFALSGLPAQAATKIRFTLDWKYQDPACRHVLGQGQGHRHVEGLDRQHGAEPSGADAAVHKAFGFDIRFSRADLFRLATANSRFAVTGDARAEVAPGAPADLLLLDWKALSTELWSLRCRRLSFARQRPAATPPMCAKPCLN